MEAAYGWSRSLTAKRKLEMDAIDAIFKETLSALKNAREQIFDIAETARAEYRRLSASVQELRVQVARAIEEVDRLEIESRKARNHLARVSSQFDRYSEREIFEAYQNAERLHVDLGVARERERRLRKQRDELERSLINLQQMVDKAEKLVSHVSVAMEFLMGNISKVAHHWEGIKLRFYIGERVIQAQEEERRRVAREIHDGPAQAMANVVLRAEICEKLFLEGREEVAQELAQLKSLVKGSLTELRRIIFNLRPMALDDLGLVPTLNRYLENLREQEHVPVKLSVSGEGPRLGSTLEVALFRLVQEAVNNARKHSRASEIKVEITFLEESTIEISISDNGIGFDLKELEAEWAQRESFGLMSMKERIELLDGQFEIVSAPGQGTRITARVGYGSHDQDDRSPEFGEL